MFKSACDAMKKSILTAGLLIFVGIILEVIAQLLTLESMVPAIFTYGGFFAISLGLVLLLATLLVILLPRVSQRLDTCQH